MTKPIDPRATLQKFRDEYPTQRDAAAALGVSQPFLNDMLQGKRNVSKKILAKLGLEVVVVKKGRAA